MAHVDEALLSVGGLPIQHYELVAVSEPSAPEAGKKVMALLLQLLLYILHYQSLDINAVGGL